MRRLALVALLAAAMLIAPATAVAGSFRLSQCTAVAGGGLSPRGFQAALWSVDNGFLTVECGAAGGVVRIGTGNWRLLDRSDTTARIALPAWMPHTAIRTAWLDYRLNPQAPSTNPAFLIVTAGGARLLEAGAGEGTVFGAALRREVPAGSRGLDLKIWCSPVNGPGWCNWPWHLLDIRGLTLELEEHEEPTASTAGALVAGGAHEGVVPL